MSKKIKQQNIQASHSPLLAETDTAIHEKSTLFPEHSTNFCASWFTNADEITVPL